MKVVFMGSSEFAVPSLLALQEGGHQVVGVVSQPDKAKGRGKKISPTPIKAKAAEMGLEVYQTDNIKSSQALDQIRQWDPEIITVASYGQIIPPAILNYPPFGCINVHASILPRYRGAAPIQRAIMAGEKSTGVTIMYMDEGLDTGDIIAQESVDISEDMDGGMLEELLAHKGARLLLEVIQNLERGVISRVKQDDSQATYAHMLKRKDEWIDWTRTAQEICNQIRGLSPAPGAYTLLDGIKLKIFAARLTDERCSGLAGQIVALSKKGFVVKTGEQCLEILEVQKEGKKRSKAVDFVRGYRDLEGRVLGQKGG